MTMTAQKSIIYRAAGGKALGLFFGLLGFFLLPEFIHNPSLLFRTAILLWYPTFGVIIGLFGIFAYHPIFKFPMPWWFRGALFGAWMNLVLTLFVSEQICTVAIGIFGEYSRFGSHYWMVIEGMMVGLIIDYLLTRWFGEGFADKVD